MSKDVARVVFWGGLALVVIATGQIGGFWWACLVAGLVTSCWVLVREET